MKTASKFADRIEEYRHRSHTGELRDLPVRVVILRLKKFHETMDRIHKAQKQAAKAANQKRRRR